MTLFATAALIFIVGLIIKSSTQNKPSPVPTSGAPAQVHLQIPSKITVTNFNTKWCGYSRQLQPVWDRITEEFERNSDIDIVDLKCDAGDKENAQCQAAGIQGYPTIVMTRPDRMGFQDQGERTFEAIKNWVLKSAIAQAHH